MASPEALILTLKREGKKAFVAMLIGMTVVSPLANAFEIELESKYGYRLPTGTGSETMRVAGTLGAGSLLEVPDQFKKLTDGHIDLSASLEAWAASAKTPDAKPDSAEAADAPRANVHDGQTDLFFPVHILHAAKKGSSKGVSKLADKTAFIALDDVVMKGLAITLTHQQTVLALKEQADSEKAADEPASGDRDAALPARDDRAMIASTCVRCSLQQASAQMQFVRGAAYSARQAVQYANYARSSGYSPSFSNVGPDASLNVSQISEKYAETCYGPSFQTLEAEMRADEQRYGAPPGTFLGIMKHESDGNCIRRGRDHEVGPFQIKPSSSSLPQCRGQRVGSAECVALLKNPEINLRESLRLLLISSRAVLGSAGEPYFDHAGLTEAKIWEMNKLAYNRGGGAFLNDIKAASAAYGRKITWDEYKTFIISHAVSRYVSAGASRIKKMASSSLAYLSGTTPL